MQKCDPPRYFLIQSTYVPEVPNLIPAPPHTCQEFFERTARARATIAARESDDTVINVDADEGGRLCFLILICEDLNI